MVFLAMTEALPDGVVLVLCPLLSLMQDQVSLEISQRCLINIALKIEMCGYPSYFNHKTTRPQRSSTVEQGRSWRISSSVCNPRDSLEEERAFPVSHNTETRLPLHEETYSNRCRRSTYDLGMDVSQAIQEHRSASIRVPQHTICGLFSYLSTTCHEICPEGMRDENTFRCHNHQGSTT